MAQAARTAPDGSPFPHRDSPQFSRELRAMFGSIAEGYDLVDHVISAGGDLLWRPRALWALDRFTGHALPSRLLDIGCGPGTFTRLLGRHYPSARRVGIDLTEAMVRRARERGAVGDPSAPDWSTASALRLPFADGSFDLAVSAFVLRSLPTLPDAFAEFRRVLSPSGALLTLEISEPSLRLRPLFHAYFDNVVPWIGASIGREGPYRYLPESLRSLPDRESLLGLMRSAGFARVEARPQSFGIVTTYLAGGGT